MHIGRLNVQTAGNLPLIAGSVLLVTGLVALIVLFIGLSGAITLNRGLMITVSCMCNSLHGQTDTFKCSEKMRKCGIKIECFFLAFCKNWPCFFIFILSW